VYTLDAAKVVQKLRHNEPLANDEARALEEVFGYVTNLVEQFGGGDAVEQASNWRLTQRRFLEYFTDPTSDKA
jgi:hypothetical protein